MNVPILRMEQFHVNAGLFRWVRVCEAIISKECIFICKALTSSLKLFSKFMLYAICTLNCFYSLFHHYCFSKYRMVAIQHVICGACKSWFSIHTENLFTTKWSPSIQVFLPHTCKLIISLLIHRGTQRYNQECCNDTGLDMLWQACDNAAYMSKVHQIQVLWVVTLSGRVVDFQSIFRWRQNSPSKCLLLTALHKSTNPAQLQKCSPSKKGQVNL